MEPEMCEDLTPHLLRWMAETDADAESAAPFNAGRTFHMVPDGD